MGNYSMENADTLHDVGFQNKEMGNYSDLTGLFNAESKDTL